MKGSSAGLPPIKPRKIKVKTRPQNIFLRIFEKRVLFIRLSI
jgi:hypothetical protein